MPVRNIRREFTRAVRLEIIRRATRMRLGFAQQWSEKCGALCTGRFEIDHRDPDAMQIDKSRKLTAADGWLLCLPCHKEKSKKDVADIAKAKRVEARHLGATRPKGKIKSAGFPKAERKHAGRAPLPPRSIYRAD